MAEEAKYVHIEPVESKGDDCSAAVPAKAEVCVTEEVSDRGLFGLGKKEEEPKEKKYEEEVIKVQECEPPVEEKKLHRTTSSSSSSSEEEVEEGGEIIKRKKKKGLKEKIAGKFSSDKKEDVKCEETAVPVAKCDDTPETPVAKCDDTPDEKKGFLDNIKEKISCHNKPGEVPYDGCCTSLEPEKEEKKGLLDRIKEKLPGHKSDEEKEKKEAAC